MDFRLYYLLLYDSITIGSNKWVEFLSRYRLEEKNGGIIMAFWNRNKSKNENQYSNYSQELVIDESTISGCFKKYFILITGMFSQSQYKNSPIMPELIAAMTSIMDFTSDYYDYNNASERKIILDWVLTPLYKSMNKRNFEKLAKIIDTRRDFYLVQSRNCSLRGEFMMDDIPDYRKNWPPYRYSVIFCDCVYNPDCLTNYDNAPTVIKSIFDQAEESAFWSSIMKDFDGYSSDIKKLMIG